MLDKSVMRRVEVLEGDAWVVCDDIGRLMPGDIFQAFEPDGTTVVDAAGFCAWVVDATPGIPSKPHIEGPHTMSPVQNGGL